MPNRNNKTIPITPFEISKSQRDPYLPNGIPINENTIKNRSIISMKGDKVKDVSIGLEDIDNAIMFYFNNVIKPTVIQDNNRVDVRVIYGNPERWKSIQQDGFLRDGNGQITLPIIVFKRDNIEKSRELGNKLDGNTANLYQVMGEKYNSRNAYDKFSILNNRIPSKQYYLSTVPDYITLKYDCVIVTNFIEQNNKIIEAIEFASDSYWGDPSRFKFRTSIDSFSTPIIIENERDRVAKSMFSIKVNGYIIPDTINKDLATVRSKFYSKSQVVFDFETTTADIDTVSMIGKRKSAMGTTSVDSYNVNITQTYGNSTILNSDLDYLNTNITKRATTIIINDTAIFSNVNILQPSTGSNLPPTTVYNFTFYINGQYVPSSIITLSDNGSNVIAIFNTGSLLYNLETDDEIIAIGKFLELSGSANYYSTIGGDIYTTTNGDYYTYN